MAAKLHDYLPLHLMKEQDFKAKAIVFCSNFAGPAVVWACVVCLQAYFTPIHSDESYYVAYAQELDWGYYDHPPMVAVMIWAGRQISDGVFGVRLITILMHLATLWLFYNLARAQNKQDLYLFWLVLLSMPLLHIYCFVATPDAPLLFTTTLFFSAYWYFLQAKTAKKQTIWACIMGTTMALMLFAKYHGVLVLLLVPLSNTRLLTSWRWYLAAVIGFCLFLPHLYWQYTHDWASFRFHLFERKGVALWWHPLEFVGNFCLTFHPFLVWIALCWAPARDSFERSLKWTFWGITLFFGFQTLRDHVQPQWLLACYVPFVLLSWRYVQEKAKRSLFVVLTCCVPILIFLHFALAFDLLPNPLGVHGNAKKMQLIADVAEGKPVLFMDSYQNASLFAWYQKGGLTHTIQTEQRRKSQFNIWMHDTAYHNKEVLVVGHWGTQMPLKEIGEGLLVGTHYFSCYERLRPVVTQKSWTSDTLYLSLEVTNMYPFTLYPRREALQITASALASGHMVGAIHTFPIDLDSLAPAHSDTFAWKIAGLDTLKASHFGYGPQKRGWPVSTLRLLALD
jgi:Dolichyl-phosphate-mannose-protein mannosyltransferase